MAQDPFSGANGTPDGDQFDGPAAIPSEYPKLVDLRTRLLLLAPTKYEQGIASAFRNNDGTVQLQNRMTANVYVVDGGAVGAFETSSFSAMYISNGRLVDQLMKAYKGQSMVLGRLDTKDGNGSKAGAGNPWGLADPTEQDKALARAYIAAGYRQPGEGPDGFAPTAPAPGAAAPTPPWAGAGTWGQTPPPWAQQAPAASPAPEGAGPNGWGQPQPAAVAPASNPWG